MGLSTSARGELQGELAGLRRLRRQIDEKIAAIEAILAPLGMVEEKGNGSAKASNPAGRPGSLRSAIHAMLVAASRPMKPLEIATGIAASGFPADGRTPLATRVRNEAWRMSNEGKLSKNKKGRYFLKDASQPVSTTAPEGGGS